MREQLAMDFRATEPRAKRTDPDTSHAVARKIRLSRTQQARDMILGILIQGGPKTDEAILRELRNLKFAISESGARTRRAELVALNLVEDSGQRAKTSMGNPCIVWRRK